MKYELLYRLSRDGYPLRRFHDLCDDEGPTLTVMKSNFDKIFGGFTDIPWKSTGAA